MSANTVIEGTWGLTQGNQLGNVPISPVTNRNSVGLGNFPTLVSEQRRGPGRVVSGEGPQCHRRAVLHQRPGGDGAELSLGKPHRQPAAEQRVSAVSLHAEHARCGHRRDEAVGIAHLQGRLPVAGQPEAAESRHRHPGGAPLRGPGQLPERQQQPARHRVRVRQRGGRRVLAVPAAERPVRRRLPLPQQGFLHPGQLEGEQQADARLRHAVHASRTAVRHPAAGVELLPGPVVREPRSAPLRAGVCERHRAVRARGG